MNRRGFFGAALGFVAALNGQPNPQAWEWRTHCVSFEVDAKTAAKLDEMIAREKVAMRGAMNRLFFP